MSPDEGVEAASFRDPSGFVFRRDGVLYRQVNRSYAPHYDRLLSSGLYQQLVDRQLLVSHEEAEPGLALTAGAYRVLRPSPIPFVSYPYEWSFAQLQDAALLTIDVMKRALRAGLVLKDATAFNVQFVGSRPILIDTLSFEIYEEGRPWIAYRQFCEHFVAPLALIACVDPRLASLLRSNLDGVPLGLASGLLPARTRLRPGLLTHVHLHARSQSRFEDRGPARASARMSRFALDALVDSLERLVRSFRWQPESHWAAYYGTNSYTPDGFAQKQQLVADFVGRVRPATVWDLGANTGAFSRVAADAGARTVAFDLDMAAVDRHYRTVRGNGGSTVLPLVLDLMNPTPSMGWEGRERASLEDRGPADLLLALALVHHLAIGHNVPLARIAEWFARLGASLIIEFVPKTDVQTQRLLSSRADIFPDYEQQPFEEAFARWFDIAASAPVADSTRTLYLMRRREGAQP